VVTQVPAGGSTSVEQSLVKHVRLGEWLDLIPQVPKGKTIDKDTMRSWGHSQTCSATAIRDILRGWLVANPDPHGLRLRGAKITGRLDLQDLTTDVNLELNDCLLEAGVVARDASLASVALTGCLIDHPAESPLDGVRLTCNVLLLGRARVIGHAGTGAVNLSGAHIGGQFDCDTAELSNHCGPALDAEGLQVDQDMLLTSGFTATGSGDGGAVNLGGAHIGGQLNCDTAELRNDSGPALDAEGLQVDQGMYLTSGFTATGSGDDGAVCLGGARIGGQLGSAGAKLCNPSGPALDTDGLQVGRGVFLRGLIAIGGGDDDSGGGAVRLAGAQIDGQLDCTGAKLCNYSGPALHAPHLEVGQDMYLTDGFTATGSGRGGAVNLALGRVGGQLDCTGAKLRNHSGPALIADSLQVGQNLFLQASDFTGSGDLGAVRLAGAHIGSYLDCTGAKLRNDTGPALAAFDLQVDQEMILAERFTAISGGEGVTVDLRDARVGGAFRFDPELEHTGDSPQLLAVDGLTYAGVPEKISPEDWRELLRHGTPRYAAQPYQQLAAAYQALGDDRKTRETLMAQRDDQLIRTHTSRWERLWGRITKVTLGYGYKPWRALWFLAGVVVVSCVLAWLLGAHGALVQTNKTATPGRSCTVLQQVSVGLDLNLPVGTSVARAACDLTKDSASVTAAWLTAVGWVLRVLAWVFAALFIAGFTGAVRKT
jgi:hypothetical protein